MRTAFVILLILSASIAQSQIFKGTVYDKSTDSTLSYAIIYISGTSIGTAADKHGNFALDVSGYASMPITISLIGYYSFTLSEHSSTKSYDIYLSPKIKELNEVVVTAKNGNRETYMRIFRREFLGESNNAMECDILNEKDLRFVYYADSSTLRAYSLQPILIHNKALGYTITYYLDKFKYTRKSGAFGEYMITFIVLGNYLIKDEILTLTDTEKRKTEERRKKAYLGSRMHFFRLLHQGNLSQIGNYNISLSDDPAVSKGFLIGSKTPVKADSLVIRQDSSSSYLRDEGALNVKFRLKYSKLTIKMDSVYFQKNGYFDPLEIWFEGEMSKQRIGDLLPFEYFLK